MGGMTDLEAFTAMCDRAGVKYEVEGCKPAPQWGVPDDELVAVTVQGDRMVGYVGFFAEALFHADGALWGFAAWE